MTWDDLSFWTSKSWASATAMLDDLDYNNTRYNPKREDLFAMMDALPYENVRVCIVGQDPYPNAEYATGIAFHTGGNVCPKTLRNIYLEYERDLHYPLPNHCNLMHWVNQGVFLWNSTLTCLTGHPGSHSHWYEWYDLTKEVIQKLSNKKYLVFVFMGARAREFAKYVDEEYNSVIETSHPSPLAARAARSPFKGSRIFTRINAELCEMSQEPIDWKLR